MAEMLGSRVNYPPDCRDACKYSGVGKAWAPGYDTCQNTYEDWRKGCIVVCVWYFLWFQKLHLFFLKRLPVRRQRNFHAILTMASTFNLEVVGAAGAVWGASEVAGRGGESLRLGWADEGFGQESFDFWRKVCGATFVVFWIRWTLRELSRAGWSVWGLLELEVDLQGSKERTDVLSEEAVHGREGSDTPVDGADSIIPKVSFMLGE